MKQIQLYRNDAVMQTMGVYSGRQSITCERNLEEMSSIFYSLGENINYYKKKNCTVKRKRPLCKCLSVCVMLLFSHYVDEFICKFLCMYSMHTCISI